MSRSRDSVPIEPLTCQLAGWLKRNGCDPPGYELVTPLAEYVEMDPSYLANIAMGRRYQWLPFDRVDKILCAIDCQYAWYTEPELAEVYKKACEGADSLEACAGLSKAERDAEYMRWQRSQAA